MADVLHILLVAPDPLARAALASLLDEPHYVIDQVDGSAEWIEQVELFEPDVIICDVGWSSSLDLPDLRDLDVPILALVANQEAAALAWQMGVKGIVGRSVSAETLQSAITATHNNLLTFDPEFVPTSSADPSAQLPPLAEPLTDRELDVLDLMAQGLTNRAIAHNLGISDHTVKFHINALLTKLGAQSRTEAAVKATRLGLLAL